jgi:hypothetical protein
MEVDSLQIFATAYTAGAQVFFHGLHRTYSQAEHDSLTTGVDICSTQGVLLQTDMAKLEYKLYYRSIPLTVHETC